MQTIKKMSASAVVSVFALTAFMAVPVHAQGLFDEASDSQTYTSKQGRCVSFKVPVAPGQGQPRTWKVAVTYCQPVKWAKGTHQVDLLTHGATYTSTYWDWPQNPDLYSYVNKTLADGRATLTYDRIGSGKSTRPLSSAEITMATDSYVLHQLVQGLKQFGFTRINSISHSYGSGVALAEAAAYADVSKVILTGYLHRPSNPAVVGNNYPANQDPKFINAGLDDGYLTTRPNTRGASFHSPSSDPNVVAYDELQKDIVSRTGLLDFLGQRAVPPASNISNTIRVPVLVVVGQQDAIFCYDANVFNCADTAAVTANESPYYASAPTFKVVTVAGSGHNLTLHPSANDSYGAISQWIKNN